MKELHSLCSCFFSPRMSPVEPVNTLARPEASTITWKYGTVSHFMVFRFINEFIVASLFNPEMED